MVKSDRRIFLKQSAISAAFALFAPRSSLFGQTTLNTTGVRPLEILTLGDSVMWGQGLNDEDKFRYRIKDWIEKDILKGTRPVNLTNYAHSGASILFKAEKPGTPSKYYYGEIPRFSPSIMQQAENAFDYFKTAKIPPPERSNSIDNFYQGKPILPENVDLILVDGGINDMEVRNFVNLKFKNEDYKAAAERFCGEAMRGLLSDLAIKFPHAKIVVTGYFQIISMYTNPTEIAKVILNLFGTSGITQFFNKLAKDLYRPFGRFAYIRKHLTEHSNTWVKESNANLEEAVNSLNRTFPFPSEDKRRALFVNPNFGPEHSYAAEKPQDSKGLEGGENIEPYLWRLGENLKTDDDKTKYRLEKKVCEVDEGNFLKLKGLDLKLCQRAGFAHPNKKGAAKYAEEIKKQLDSVTFSIST